METGGRKPAVSGEGALNPYTKTVGGEWYRQRLTGTMFCVIGAFMVLIGRLFYLQVMEGEEYRRLSENNCIRLQRIAAPRGGIYDRRGVLLADNRPSFDLGIVLKDAEPLADTVKKLARCTGIPEKEIFEKIRKGKRGGAYKPVLLKEDIGRDILAVIEARHFDLPGIAVDFKPRRQYLHGGTASHLLGYLGEISEEELKSGNYPEVRGGELVGKYGIEKSGGHFLRGRKGGRQVEVNARGQVVRVLDTVDAVPGHNLYLTIDFRLQQAAEELLTGKVGALVALEPDSGKVIAMASMPGFDQNRFIKGISHPDWKALISNPDRPLENKAVQGEYPPASTYKIVTALAGLEEGVVDLKSTAFCPGYYRFGDRIFRCWRRGGHGTVNVTGALAVSCDVYFYQLGQKLGVDRLAEYARACGLGAPTGIALPHESAGLIPTALWKKKRTGVPWQKGETLSIAIGQGYNLVTPVQMAVLTAAVANGGTLYRPALLEKVVSAGGETVKAFEKEIAGRIPVRPEHLEIVKRGLWEVVNGSRGTARLARIEHVDISGKTGTAQVISRKKGDRSYSKKLADRHKPHAWFVAYGSRGEKKIAVAVIIEHGEHGSGTAAPIARDFIRAALLGQYPRQENGIKTAGE